MKFFKYFGYYALIIGGLVGASSGWALASDVSFNVSANGDNSCSGPASFSPTEVPVHEGDNVTLIFSVAEAQDWSISTNHYTQWGTALVPAGQSRAVSFVAPASSFSYQGSWAINGCYRASGVVRVVPLPNAAPPPPPPPIEPPGPADPKTVFEATAPPAMVPRSPSTINEDAAAGLNSTTAPGAVANVAVQDAAEKVTPVSFLDGLVVVGCVVFGGLCVGGLVILNRPKAEKLNQATKSELSDSLMQDDRAKK